MISAICKWMVFKWIYPLWYHLGIWKKVDPNKIIMVENHQDTLSDNFQLLYENLQAEHYEIHVHYLQVAASGWGKIIIRTLGLIRDMWDTSVILVSESNSVFGAFQIRKQTKLVQLWHACGAFKKWGFSVAEQSFGEDRKELIRYSGHWNYDLVPVSGERVCHAYEEAFGLAENSGIVRPLGVSRTDRYFDPFVRQEAIQILKQAGIPVGDRKLILYAPTFRGEIKDAVSPDALDIAACCREFHKEYVLLIKQHPFVKKKPQIPGECRGFCYDASMFSTEHLLMVSDICITDYSSIVFEYSLLEKPILFYAYDLESYYDERGFYYPYESFVPGPIVKTTEELIYWIHHVDSFDINRLKDFRMAYMNGCDGHSTERILKAVL